RYVHETSPSAAPPDTKAGMRWCRHKLRRSFAAAVSSDTRNVKGVLSHSTVKRRLFQFNDSTLQRITERSLKSISILFARSETVAIMRASCANELSSGERGLPACWVRLLAETTSVSASDTGASARSSDRRPRRGGRRA